MTQTMKTLSPFFTIFCQEYFLRGYPLGSRTKSAQSSTTDWKMAPGGIHQRSGPAKNKSTSANQGQENKDTKIKDLRYVQKTDIP